MNGYDIEICDHCGCEFEVGYWRRDLSLCEDCLSLADDVSDPLEVAAEDLLDVDDDWTGMDVTLTEELDFEPRISGY